VRYRVLLTSRAEMDVEAVLRWFCEQGANKSGARWLMRLQAKIKTLESQPGRCGLAAESGDIGDEVRELLMGLGRYKHRILFKIIDRKVIILRVWHSSRNAITPEDLQD
jgi:plasmid stabilization system protein ParE